MNRPRRAIYSLLMGDKYRRQKLQQGQGEDLLPEWNPADSNQIHSEEELIQFLNGRIDGLLNAWDALTKWRLSDMVEVVLRAEKIRWEAQPWDWIDLSVVDHVDGEVQCPGCGSIHQEDALLWFGQPWADTEDLLKLCDSCAGRMFNREKVAAAEAERADRIGGQKPVDATFGGKKA